MKNQLIPIFYHIPKNSGTYTYNCILNGVKKIYKNIRVIRILDDSKFVLTKVIACDNNSFLNSCNKFIPINNSKITWDLNIQDLTEGVLEKFSILAIIVEARGFRIADHILGLFAKKLLGIDLHKFIILRDPFSREQSLYHYLTSDKSKHEKTHGVFKSLSFKEHLSSKQLQDNWLIRSLLNIPRGVAEITQEDFNKACSILQDFNIYDVKNTEKAIADILYECFEITNNELLNISKMNNNSYEKIKFEDLPENLQKRFNERTFWDQKLYKTFTKI